MSGLKWLPNLKRHTQRFLDLGHNKQRIFNASNNYQSVISGSLPPRQGTSLGKDGGMASSMDGNCKYEGWNFNSGNYLFTTDTK